MKKIFFCTGLALVMAIGIRPQHAYATSQGISRSPGPKITEALLKYFPKATQISWEKRDGNKIARFYVDGNYIQAKFSQKGRLLYSYSNCNPQRIPVYILSRLQDAYPGYTAETAVEYSGSDQYCYFVWMKKSNAQHTKWIRVKAEPYGTLAVISRMQQRTLAGDRDSILAKGKAAVRNLE